MTSCTSISHPSFVSNRGLVISTSIRLISTCIKPYALIQTIVLSRLSLNNYWMLFFLFCLFALSPCQRLLFTARICMRRHGFEMGTWSLSHVSVKWEPVITPCQTFQHERVGPACQKRTEQKALTTDGRTSLVPAASQ